MRGHRQILPVARFHKELPEANTTSFSRLVRAGDGPLNRIVLRHSSLGVTRDFVLVPRVEFLLKTIAEKVDPK